MKTEIASAVCAAVAALSSAFAAPKERVQQVGTWWHWMNGHVTREGIAKDLAAMKSAGIDNATIFNAYRPFGGQFTAFAQVAKENVRDIDESVMPTVKFASKEWMDLFRFALDEAEKLGITIGAANCDGWSESGGPWITPELAMKELVWERLDAEGPKPVVRDGFYREIAVVEANGRKYRFGYTTNGKRNHPASPEGVGLECDKMDAAALEWHFKHYPQWLLDAAGDHAGKTFRYFLVDSWECGFQTWTAKFPEEFLKRRGYDITPWLPVLAGETVGSPEDSEAFLHDYRLTCSDLIIDNYFKRLAELCHERKMLLYSEGIYGWDNLPAVDVLKTYRYCDVPMTEFWAKIAARKHPFKMSYAEPIKHFSPQHAAVLYGKPVVAGEAYTGYGLYSDSPFDLKPYGDRAFAHGITRMILHSCVHQPTDAAPGLTLGIYGQAFNRLNPWYNFSASFWAYHERIQDAMQGGAKVADALVYIGDTLPAFEMSDDEIARLLPHGASFQYLNQDVLLSGRVSVDPASRRIMLDGDKSYKSLVVRQDALDLATVVKLGELAKAGAEVCGVKPVRTLRLKDREAETARLVEIADSIWGGEAFKPANRIAYFKDIEFGSDGDIETVFARHVRKGGRDVYFIASAFDFAERLLRVRFPAHFHKSTAAVVLDPVDGRRYALDVPVASNPMVDGWCTLRLRPRQSVIVTLGEDATGLPSYKGEVLTPHILSKRVYDGAEGTITFESEPDMAPLPIGRFRSLTGETDPDVKYFCGVLRYDFTLELPVADAAKERVLLTIPQFGSTAEVTVNGRLAGTVWDPYAPLDITEAVRAGGGMARAAFSVRVANPWRNRLVGDFFQDRGAKAAFTTSPGIDKYDMKPHVSKNAELLPTGISRPITVATVPDNSLQARIWAAKPGETISLPAGTYREKLVIPAEKKGLRLVHEGEGEAVLLWDDYSAKKAPDGNEFGTFRTYTLKVEADDVELEGLTIVNNASDEDVAAGGRGVGQAVALHLEGDRIAVRRCVLRSYQDTLYTTQNGRQCRQYFEDCRIEGSVDFIFGHSTVLFRNCDLVHRIAGMTTAAATPEGEKFGYVFHKCRVFAENGQKSILGRPWREYAQTVFLDCEISDCIKPVGWTTWRPGDGRDKTIYYAEFDCKGSGADVSNRPGWVHVGAGDRDKYFAERGARDIPADVIKGEDGWRPF